MEADGDLIYLYYHEHILAAFDKETMDVDIDVRIILFLALGDTCQKMLKQKCYDKILSNEMLYCIWFNVLNEIITRKDLGIVINEW